MEKKEYDREYLGITITAQNYREVLKKEGRMGINFHNKHLRCYLRGDKKFTFGCERDENGTLIRDKWNLRVPKQFNVQQKLTKLGTD